MNPETYQTICEETLLPNELSALVRLYQPVFSVPALSLYLTLYECGQRQLSVSRETLCSMIQVDHDQLLLLRVELERFMLVRTFAKADKVTVVVRRPLSMTQFIKHPILGRLYSLVCGAEGYQKIVAECLEKSQLIAGEEITKPFDATRLTAWDEALEEDLDTLAAKPFAPHFDAEVFFKNLSPVIFPVELRTEGVKKLVADLGSLHQVSFREMKSALMVTSKNGRQPVDERTLVRVVEEKMGKREMPKEAVDPYSLDPVSFLQLKQNHAYVIDADRNLIRSLAENFKFENPVINALLEYVLESNHGNLAKAYVEKVASTWKRQHVSTLEDALKAIARPTTQTSRQKTAVVPTYSKEDRIDGDVEAMRQAMIDKYNKEGS